MLLWCLQILLMDQDLLVLVRKYLLLRNFSLPLPDLTLSKSMEVEDWYKQLFGAMEQFWLTWKAALSLYIATLLWFKTNVQNEQQVDVIMHMLFSNTILFSINGPLWWVCQSNRSNNKYGKRYTGGMGKGRATYEMTFYATPLLFICLRLNELTVDKGLSHSPLISFILEKSENLET